MVHIIILSLSLVGLDIVLPTLSLWGASASQSVSTHMGSSSNNSSSLSSSYSSSIGSLLSGAPTSTFVSSNSSASSSSSSASSFVAETVKALPEKAAVTEYVKRTQGVTNTSEAPAERQNPGKLNVDQSTPLPRFEPRPKSSGSSESSEAMAAAGGASEDQRIVIHGFPYTVNRGTTKCISNCDADHNYNFEYSATDAYNNTVYIRGVGIGHQFRAAKKRWYICRHILFAGALTAAGIAAYMNKNNTSKTAYIGAAVIALGLIGFNEYLNFAAWYNKIVRWYEERHHVEKENNSLLFYGSGYDEYVLMGGTSTLAAELAISNQTKRPVPTPEMSVKKFLTS